MEDIKTILPLSKPWEFAIPNQKVPLGLSSLSAAHCGSCHQNHYNEWKKSTHAQAWKDLQFQAELKKESSPFMCINCHIPLQNQQEHIINGLEDGDIYKPIKVANTYFDRELQHEGITCAACHVRDSKIIGPNGSTNAPHLVVRDIMHLSEQLCLSCHNATAVVTPTLACSFETGDEWKSGPYFGKKNCISCHMPSTQRSIVTGYPLRSSRFHNFPGSGIPKLDTLNPERLESLTFLSEGIKSTYRINDTLHFSFSLTNNQAGHRVPTGNPERFIAIEFKISDEYGNILKTQRERIGEVWEWYPVAKKISDNNLNLGESRKFFLHQTLNKKGKLNLTVDVSKHRLTRESATYNKLGFEYPLYIKVFSDKKYFNVK